MGYGIAWHASSSSPARARVSTQAVLVTTYARSAQGHRRQCRATSTAGATPGRADEVMVLARAASDLMKKCQMAHVATHGQKATMTWQVRPDGGDVASGFTRAALMRCARDAD